MSRRVVGYEGEGRHRRPIYDNEGPASVAAAGPLAGLDRLSTDALIPTGGAGPVERRQANEAMRAAWRREALPDTPPVVAPVPPRMTEDELVDAYRSTEEKEPDMDEPEPTTFTDPLLILAAAAEEAAAAREAFEAARLRRQASVDALRSAWDALGLVTEPAAADTLPTPIRQHEPRRRPGNGTQRAESVDERGRRVLEVLDRHNGNTKAAGEELGMRGNVVARIAMAARARAAAAS